MSKKKLFLLQMFADGGDGGASSEGAEGGNEESGEEIPAFIPEKAKAMYRKSLERTKANVPKEESVEEKPQEESKPSHISFDELIKSDEYKDEYKEHFEKSMSKRFKKYEGMEATLSKQKNALEIIAQKYGIDPSSEDFLDTITKSIEDDDSIYEQYAMDNDMSTEEAKKVMSLERKVAKAEEEKRMQEEVLATEERNNRLFTNAEKTKQMYPGFNLEEELQNPQFVRLCMATNEDTTAAYRACHWNELLATTVQKEREKAQIESANAIKSNSSRPIENGLGSSQPILSEIDYSKMNLQQIRQQAEIWRRAKR